MRRGKTARTSGPYPVPSIDTVIAGQAGTGSTATVASKIIRQRLQQPCRMPLSIFRDADAGFIRSGRVLRDAGKARLRRLAASDINDLSRYRPRQKDRARWPRNYV